MASCQRLWPVCGSSPSGLNGSMLITCSRGIPLLLAVRAPPLPEHILLQTSGPCHPPGMIRWHILAAGVRISGAIRERVRSQQEGNPDERRRDVGARGPRLRHVRHVGRPRSEEHTSELQSRQYLVCRLLLEKKKTTLV